MKATDAYREINESPVKGIILYYTEKILSNLPNVMLNDVISKIQTGKTPPKSQSKYYEIEEIDWFKPSDIGHGIYLEEAGERFAQVAVTEKKATIYPKNTLLMIGIGGGVGRVSILRNEGSSNQQITGITFKSFIYPEWAYYYYLVREDYVKSQAKSMSFPILNQDKIKSLDFKFPTYEEQVEFCNFLNHVWKCFKSGQVPELEYFDISEELKEYTLKQFKIITLNNNIHLNAKARKSLLTQLKQAILQEAIEGKLTAAWREQNPDVEPASELLKRIKAKKDQLIKERKIKKEKPLPFISEAEIPFALPESWVWCRLGEVLLSSDAGKSPNCEKRPATHNEWGVLTTTSIQEGYFDEAANKVLPQGFKINLTQVVEVDDILITRAGPINRTGIVCKVASISRNLILSDKTIRLKHIRGLVSSDYIVQTLNSKGVRSLLLPNMTGMAESQVNISQSDIKTTLIPFAPIEEQKVINRKVVNLLEKAQALEAEITQSEQHAQMLMQAVLKEAFSPANTPAPAPETEWEAPEINQLMTNAV